MLPGVQAPRRLGAGLAFAVLAAACATRGHVLTATSSTTSAVHASSSLTTTSSAPTTTPPTSTTEAPPSSTTSTTTTTILFVPPAPGTVTVRTPNGVLALLQGPSEDGRFLVRSPCERNVLVDRVEIVKGIDVLLDPGHGGLDPGAKSEAGQEEAELNLDVAQRVAKILRDAGHSVELTRGGDYFRTIATRAQLAVSIEPKAFVSIHHNAGLDAPSSAGIGSEIYNQRESEASRRLGGVIYSELDKSLRTFDVAWTRSAHFGVRYRANDEGGDFYGVLRRSEGVPAVLIEAAYLSNPKEAAVLGTDAFRSAEANAIAAGILRWLTTNDEGSGFQPGFVEDGAGGTTDLSACRDPKL